MFSATHYTLLQLRPSLGYLGSGDYFTAIPNNTPSKMAAHFSGKGMISVLRLGQEVDVTSTKLAVHTAVLFLL